jgi:hypothetical protein
MPFTQRRTTPNAELTGHALAAAMAETKGWSMEDTLPGPLKAGPGVERRG